MEEGRLLMNASKLNIPGISDSVRLSNHECAEIWAQMRIRSWATTGPISEQDEDFMKVPNRHPEILEELAKRRVGGFNEDSYSYWEPQ